MTTAEIELLAAPGVIITGVEPVLPACYPLATRAAEVLAAIGCRSAAIWQARGGEPQRVSVDLRHAGALMRGFYDMELGGEVLDPDPTGKLPLARAYRTRDGRWIQLYGVMEPLANRTLELLGCAGDAASVAGAVARWEAFALEDALAGVGAAATVVRTASEWSAHPHGAALAARPLVALVRIGDAPPRPWTAAARPLEGVRVLDLTRVVAGPVCARTLGEHGAGVLAVCGQHLPWIRRAMVDTGPGKRAAQLDLEDPADHAHLLGLIGQADVFCQGARPGRLAARGLGPAELAARRPGLVYVSIDGWGPEGPWSDRAGFEALAHAATGWTADHLDSGGAPRAPGALAGDHLTGYLAALGVLTALERRAVSGGSWHVHVSLARTVGWLRSGGPVLAPAAGLDLSVAATGDLRVPLAGGFGVARQLRPAPSMSRTPPRWAGGAYPPGTHRASF